MALSFGIPILALAAVLQASMISLWFGSAGPDLIFLIVLAWSINVDLRKGLVWAFIGGLMLDLLSAAPLGTSSIGLMLVVFMVSGLGSQFYQVRLPLLAVLTAGGTLVRYFALYAIIILLARTGLLNFPEQPQTLIFIPDLTSTILATLVYNLVLIWPAYWLVRRIQSRTRTEE